MDASPSRSRSFGGNLVTVNNAAEETWFKQTFGSNERFWIGLSDRSDEGNFQVEIFTPPYLYNEDSTLADRPVIGSGADSIGYNQSFNIAMDTDMPITEFNLVRMSAVTHGVNTDQRFISVDFTDLGNNNYELNSPDNGNIAPPGQYMLFAMNDKGAPSEAKIIQIA